MAEIESSDPNIAFGLCDLGIGCPETGSIDLLELEAVCDPHFKPQHPLSVYEEAARIEGAFTEDAQALDMAAAKLLLNKRPFGYLYEDSRTD